MTTTTTSTATRGTFRVGSNRYDWTDYGTCIGTSPRNDERDGYAVVRTKLGYTVQRYPAHAGAFGVTTLIERTTLSMALAVFAAAHGSDAASFGALKVADAVRRLEA